MAMSMDEAIQSRNTLEAIYLKIIKDKDRFFAENAAHSSPLENPEEYIEKLELEITTLNTIILRNLISQLEQLNNELYTKVTALRKNAALFSQIQEAATVTSACIDSILKILAFL